MPILERLIYVSTAAQGIALPEVRHIVARAQIRNRQLDVTGMLLFMQGEFVQVLEGRRAMLDQVVQYISGDPRHHGIQLIERRRVSTRRFDRWHMGLIVTDAMADAVSRMKQGELSVDTVIDALLADADLF